VKEKSAAAARRGPRTRTAPPCALLAKRQVNLRRPPRRQFIAQLALLSKRARPTSDGENLRRQDALEQEVSDTELTSSAARAPGTMGYGRRSQAFWSSGSRVIRLSMCDVGSARRPLSMGAGGAPELLPSEGEA
jgi:hypothetical protein